MEAMTGASKPISRPSIPNIFSPWLASSSVMRGAENPLPKNSNGSFSCHVSEKPSPPNSFRHDANGERKSPGIWDLAKPSPEGFFLLTNTGTGRDVPRGFPDKRFPLDPGSLSLRRSSTSSTIWEVQNGPSGKPDRERDPGLTLNWWSPSWRFPGIRTSGMDCKTKVSRNAFRQWNPPKDSFRRRTSSLTELLRSLPGLSMPKAPIHTTTADG